MQKKSNLDKEVLLPLVSLPYKHEFRLAQLQRAQPIGWNWLCFLRRWETAFWLMKLALLLTIANMLATSFEAFITLEGCTPKKQLADIMNQIDPKPNQIWEKCPPPLIVNTEPMTSSGYFMLLYWKRIRGKITHKKQKQRGLDYFKRQLSTFIWH